MNYKNILENWKKFTQQAKPLTLNERREIMNEISQQTAERIYDWMRDQGSLSYDFDEIFGENMRVAIPMDSHDTRMLKSILRAIKEEGWVPPISPGSRERQRSIYSYEKGQETGQGNIGPGSAFAILEGSRPRRSCFRISESSGEFYVEISEVGRPLPRWRVRTDMIC